MRSSEKVKVIRSHPLFKNLEDYEIKLIANWAQDRIIPPKTVFIKQGDLADFVYFISEGTVRVYSITENGQERTRALQGSGTVIGEMALIDGVPRSAYVASVQEVHALTLSREDFRKVITEQPSISLEILASLSKKLRDVNKQAENNLFLELKNRTWKTLQYLSSIFPDKCITLSHEEIATIVGSTRPRITEVLQSFERQGLISSHRRRITVLKAKKKVVA
jgi:CRP-like cAMP-binding protein